MKTTELSEYLVGQTAFHTSEARTRPHPFCYLSCIPLLKIFQTYVWNTCYFQFIASTKCTEHASVDLGLQIPSSSSSYKHQDEKTLFV